MDINTHCQVIFFPDFKELWRLPLNIQIFIKRKRIRNYKIMKQKIQCFFCLISHNNKNCQVKHLNGRKAEFSSHALSAHYGIDLYGAWASHNSTPGKCERMQLSTCNTVPFSAKHSEQEMKKKLLKLNLLCRISWLAILVFHCFLASNKSWNRWG